MTTLSRLITVTVLFAVVLAFAQDPCATFRPQFQAFQSGTTKTVHEKTLEGGVRISGEFTETVMPDRTAVEHSLGAPTSIETTENIKLTYQLSENCSGVIVVGPDGRVRTATLVVIQDPPQQPPTPELAKAPKRKLRPFIPPPDLAKEPRPYIPPVTVSAVEDDEDQVLGLNTHNSILQQTPLMPMSGMVSTVEAVYRNMVQTPTYAAGASSPPSLFVLNSSVINAYATAGGRLYVSRGLVESVKGDPGILAFVIGHEMVHNRNRHGVKRYLRAIQADYIIRTAYRRSVWAGLATRLAQKVIESRIQRGEEHEADKLGLLIAAEAGYHPDFAILAARHLRTDAGEASKAAAFFQGHPRWTTREQRAEGTRDRALATFSARWQDAKTSPGGQPPTFVAMDEWKKVGDKDGITISFSTAVRNVQDSPVVMTVWLVRENPAANTKLDEKIFDASAEQQWSFALDKKPKDKLGKRYVRIVAKAGDQPLWETEAIKVD